MKNRWWDALKLVLSLGLLAYVLLFQVNLASFGRTLAGARWGYLALAMLLMVIGTALRAVRWKALLDALGIRVRLARLTELYFVGAFFNIFLPTGLGGDAVKMAELTRDTGRGPEAVGTTLVDRALGLWVLFVMALAALPFSHGVLPEGWIGWITAAGLAGVVGGWLVMGTPLLPWLAGKVHLPGQAKLERFSRAVAQLGYPALLRAGLVSLLFNMLLIGFNVLIAAALHVRLPLGLFLEFTPIISFSLALPISIGGLGVREETYVLLFGALGIAAETAVAMSLANYLLSTVGVGLIGGALYAAEGLRGVVKKFG